MPEYGLLPVTEPTLYGPARNPWNTGHTPGGCTFLFHDPAHGGTDIGLFGDSLFHLSVGRTDLGGDARVYARTIRDVILALPDETVVHSGHGPSSTMAVERAMNPFLNGDVSLDAPGGW